jgi:VanZ family protein
VRRVALPLLALGYAGLIFYLSSRSTLPVALPQFNGVDKVAHLIEYSGLGLLVAWTLGSRGLAKGRALWLAGLVCALYGASDELHQLFVPGRQCDVFDWVADTAGGALGAVTWYWASRKDPR